MHGCIFSFCCFAYISHARKFAERAAKVNLEAFDPFITFWATYDQLSRVPKRSGGIRCACMTHQKRREGATNKRLSRCLCIVCCLESDKYRAREISDDCECCRTRNHPLADVIVLIAIESDEKSSQLHLIFAPLCSLSLYVKKTRQHQDETLIDSKTYKWKFR